MGTGTLRSGGDSTICMTPVPGGGAFGSAAAAAEAEAEAEAEAVAGRGAGVRLSSLSVSSLESGPLISSSEGGGESVWRNTLGELRSEVGRTWRRAVCCAGGWVCAGWCWG